MKRVLPLLLVVAMMAGVLAACGSETYETPVITNADNGNDASSASTDISTDTTVVEEPDVPPAEGMVRSALTGEWIDEDMADQRPLAVMMPTDQAAQPQYGIGKADILYECMEEGGVSRQMAVISDWQNLERIGNVRSCRDYYLVLSTEWDAVLVHFGGVFYMRDRIQKGDIQNISGTYSDGTAETTAPGSEAFFRSKDKASPHNAYVSAESVLAAMKSLNYPKTHRRDLYEPDHFNFSKNEVDLSGEDKVISAKTVDLCDSYPASKSFLEYNEADGLYYKSLHGEKQIDALTGEQLAFKNILIQTTYWEKRDEKYLAFQMHDVTRFGYYVTNGKAIPIRWEKTSDYGPTKYYDLKGNEISINVGKTYIAIIQEGTEPKFS
ncbi:MAG: DUF3048 domain-containing protein [Lachnospiraceae bacterium]|nr:DUF3048 domain-containing protein [Lachnospiraceae bacterium]